MAHRRRPRDAFDKRAAVIGGTFSGNKGAAGMLESVIVNLGHRLPGRVRFDVLSVYPKRDRARPLPDNVRVVPAPPLMLIGVLPPVALLYAALGALRLPRRFLLAFRPLRAIVEADVLLDVSGISYVDGRTAALLYNVACNLPAILVGTPLVKLSQALGPFRTPVNRAAARLVLPRARRIYARGKETEGHLASLGLSNTAPAADLAFALNEHEPIPPLPERLAAEFEPGEPVVGVCPSEVLDRSCARRGIDFTGELARALDAIHEETGARVAIVAHSLLGPEKRSLNNDYHVCMRLHARMAHRDRAVLVVDDLTPSQLRAVIARCSCLVAARFHGMISALCVGVPPVVPAWSHKYREVMREFGLERFVIEQADIGGDAILSGIRAALDERESIARGIQTALVSVMASARAQIDDTARMISGLRRMPRAGPTAKRLYDRFYRGTFRGARIGYAADAGTRERAASGGLVSALLADELRAGRIDGAIACRTRIEAGRLSFETVLCRTPEEIASCSTSIYSDFNHAREALRLLEANRGTFALVALPCQWRAIDRALAKRPAAGGTIGLKVGLWCGHATDRRLIEDFLRVKGIPMERARRLWYRRGLWRGETVVELDGGETREMAFSTGYGLLQNLYVDCRHRCFSCPDHFAAGSDVSFGDAWLGELRNAPVKHSLATAFTERGEVALEALAGSGAAWLTEVPPEIAVQAQKRAVVWHTYGAAGRSRIGRLFGLSIPDRAGVAPRWNDYLSAFLILAAYRAYGSPLRPALLKMPWQLVYPYMLAQKALLNF
jgi:coenzyme F420-reducing hydrogenase beta subunit/polysaccharide pyruvyl transferase WcaK-like protein